IARHATARMTRLITTASTGFLIKMSVNDFILGSERGTENAENDALLGGGVRLGSFARGRGRAGLTREDCGAVVELEGAQGRDLLTVLEPALDDHLSTQVGSE